MRCCTRCAPVRSAPVPPLPAAPRPPDCPAPLRRRRIYSGTRRDISPAAANSSPRRASSRAPRAPPGPHSGPPPAPRVSPSLPPAPRAGCGHPVVPRVGRPRGVPSVSRGCSPHRAGPALPRAGPTPTRAPCRGVSLCFPHRMRPHALPALSPCLTPTGATLGRSLSQGVPTALAPLVFHATWGSPHPTRVPRVLLEPSRSQAMRHQEDPPDAGAGALKNFVPGWAQGSGLPESPPRLVTLCAGMAPGPPALAAPSPAPQPCSPGSRGHIGSLELQPGPKNPGLAKGIGAVRLLRAALRHAAARHVFNPGHHHKYFPPKQTNLLNKG